MLGLQDWGVWGSPKGKGLCSPPPFAPLPSSDAFLAKRDFLGRMGGPGGRALWQGGCGGHTARAPREASPLGSRSTKMGNNNNNNNNNNNKETQKAGVTRQVRPRAEKSRSPVCTRGAGPLGDGPAPGGGSVGRVPPCSHTCILISFSQERSLFQTFRVLFFFSVVLR